MANIDVTQIDVGNIALRNESFRDEILNFAGAHTCVKGTLLARITASGKLTPYVVGGSGGAGVPVAVLTYEVAATGAGDVAIRALVAGEVNRNRLVIDADGDGHNITNAILDQLRDYAIQAIDVAALGGTQL